MQGSTRLVSIQDIREAAVRLSGTAVRTPLISAPWAGELSLKAENLQPMGAFKLRGAFNAVALVDPELRKRGVIAHSSGNHGQALAWAARAHGIPAVIVMPDAAVEVKIEATRALGAEVVLVPAAEREAKVEVLRAERGMTLIPPFDHPDVIAGAGTVGLEIIEDHPRVETVLVPVGGGGLISGVATAVKALAPHVRVVAVEPDFAADLAESVDRGERVSWEAALTYRTIADGVRSTEVGVLTWRHIQAHVDDVVTVSEEAILDAMGLIARNARIVAEPTGSLATAAFLAQPERFGQAVAIVSGGNAEPALLAQVIADGRTGRAGRAQWPGPQPRGEAGA